MQGMPKEEEISIAGLSPDGFFDTEHLKGDLKGRFVRGTAVTTLGQAVWFVIHTASTVVLARLLSPEDYGLVAMVTAVTGFIMIFKDLGLDIADPKVRYYQTNRFGADLMRQAVNYGYQEGLRAGRADREDGWRSDYRNSLGYRNASYGYYGYYLDQDQYRYYFRQGFRRGYEDGYYGRYRYGRRNDDGTFVVLAAVLAVILGLELLD